MARFGHPLSFKSPAAAFECLWTAKPSAAACEGLPPALPWAPQAVSIGLRNCYVAHFGHPLKASKAAQQLSKAFEPQNPPQQLAKAPRLLCHSTPPEAPQAVSIGLRNCYVARFGHPLKASKAQHSFRRPLNRKTLRSSLRRCPACFATVPLPRPHKLFLLGFETATWHVLGTPYKSLKSPAAFEGLWTAKPSAAACEGVPPALPWCHTSCFYWASKLLRGTFWAPLKSLKSPAFEPQNPPQQLAKASRLLCHGTSLSPTSCFY